MVQEIIKNINRKTEEKIGLIKNKAQAEILDLERSYESKIKEEKKARFKNREEEIKEEIEEFSRLKESEFDFSVQRKKGEILKEVYENAQKKIASLPNKDLSEILSNLIVGLPDLDGDALAGEKSAALLKNLLKIPVKGGLEEEGFVIRTPEADFDFRISRVLDYLREKTDPETIKILFSE